jgi:hypothetical protein
MTHTSHYTYSDARVVYVVTWVCGRWVTSSLGRMTLDDIGRIVMDPENETRPVYVRALFWPGNSIPLSAREAWTPRGGWQRVPGIDHAMDIARMEQDTP